MAIVASDKALQAMDMEHLPTPGVDSHIRSRLDDGPLAGQIPLPGEPFGRGLIGECVGVVSVRSRQIAAASPDRAILAERDPYLAGFRHAA
jgi:hypothetical protein